MLLFTQLHYFFTSLMESKQEEALQTQRPLEQQKMLIWSLVSCLMVIKLIFRIKSDKPMMF